MPFVYNLIIFVDFVGLHIVEQSLWKAVPHYLRRVSSALKKVHIKWLPLFWI